MNLTRPLPLFGSSIFLSLFCVIGFSLFLMTAHLGFHDYYHLPTVAKIHPGFSHTPLGITIGLIWSLVDGFSFGLILTLIINAICNIGRKS